MVDKESILEISEQFKLGTVSSFENAGGAANRNFIVKTDTGVFVLKFLIEHSEEDFQKELVYLERIIANDFSTPMYLSDREGNFVFQGSEQNVVVLPYVEGKHPPKITPPMARSIGEYLALLHKTPCENLPERGSWWRSSFLEESLKKLQNYPDSENYKKFENLVNSIDRLKNIKFEQALCHGDLWPGNILFQGNEVVTFLDWEEATVAPAFYDLANVALHICFQEKKFEEDNFYALLEGYQSRRNFSEAEKEYFQSAVTFVALTNSLWLLLRYGMEEINKKKLELVDSYWSLPLELLVIP